MTKICPSCGRELPQEAAFCPWCELVLVEKAPAAVPRPRHKKRQLLAAAVIFTLCLLVLPKAFQKPSPPMEAPAQKIESPQPAEAPPVEATPMEELPTEEAPAEEPIPPHEPPFTPTLPMGACLWGLENNILYIAPADGDHGVMADQGPNGWPWEQQKQDIHQVIFAPGVILSRNASQMFQDCLNLQEVQCRDLDTSQTIDLSLMFHNCELLQSIDVSQWDISNVVSLYGMFWWCRSIEELNVSQWDTANTKTLESLFSGCNALRALDVSNWDTSQVTTLHCTFALCESLEVLDVSGWDTSQVTSMRETFNSCPKLHKLDVSQWDTSQVVYMDLLFQYNRIKDLNLSGWDTSKVISTNHMFTSAFNMEVLTVGPGFTLPVSLPAVYASSADQLQHEAIVPGVAATYTIQSGAIYKVYEGRGEVIYPNEDGDYHLLVGYDSDRLRQTLQGEPYLALDLPKGEETTVTAQLHVYQEGVDADVQATFWSRIVACTVNVNPIQDAIPMTATEPDWNQNYPHSGRVSDITFTGESGKNEILWTLTVNNGDTIYLRHIIETHLSDQ